MKNLGHWHRNYLCAVAIVIVSSSCVSSNEPPATELRDPSPASAHCTLEHVAADLQHFFEVIQEPGGSTEELFATEPDFAWFSLSPPKSLREELPHASIHDRAKLEPYFQRRAEAGQRLLPSEAVIKIDNHRRTSAAVSLSGMFRADDVAARGLYFGGKAEIHCASGAVEVMSLAVGVEEPTRTCSSNAGALKGMRYCEPQRD